MMGRKDRERDRESENGINGREREMLSGSQRD